MSRALMILGRGYDDQGGIDAETIMRLKTAKEHVDKVSSIILPGYEKQNIAMENWLIDNIPMAMTIYPVEAHDTIGQAVFSFPLVKALKIKELIIVTSDYHLKRTKVIFEKIYGDHCSLSFIGCTVYLPDRDLLLKDEEESLKLFQENFSYAESCYDHMAILFHHHPRYQHITFKPADQVKDSSDASLIWQWRNDPITRQMSRSSEFIPFEKHQEWYLQTLKDKNKVIRLAFLNGEAFGMVRFDLFKENKAELNININPLMRGRGLGYTLLEEACKYGKNNLNLFEIIAEIKPENKNSIAIFEKAGFTFQGIHEGMRRYLLNT